MHRYRLVGHHDLEIEFMLVGNEQVQLDRPFALFFDPGANEAKTKASPPALRLPAVLKVTDLIVEVIPTLTLLDLLLQQREPFEWNREGKFHPLLIQHLDNRVTEKGAVHPDFDLHLRQNLPNHLDTSQNELAGSVGVMHVARAVV